MTLMIQQSEVTKQNVDIRVYRYEITNTSSTLQIYAYICPPKFRPSEHRLLETLSKNICNCIQRIRDAAHQYLLGQGAGLLLTPRERSDT